MKTVFTINLFSLYKLSPVYVFMLIFSQVIDTLCYILFSVYIYIFVFIIILFIILVGLFLFVYRLVIILLLPLYYGE